jgi:ABC-2 type transport system permease protein
MAWLLVRLKLRLLVNALRSSNSAKATFITSTIFAALVAIGTFALLSAFRGQAASVYVTSVIFTLFAFGWLILPIFVFGLDSTLDPATLALYPLRIRPLATGLLAASATGAWPLANVIGLLGVTVGLASGPSGLIVAVIAVPLQVLFCITLARLVTTSMAGLLRSRRGKDLAVFLFIPLFVLYETFTQVVPAEAAGHKLSAASFHGLDSWLRWLPPGLAAHAIRDASDGHLGTAVLRLALLAAVVVGLGWLWVRLLSQALITADTTTQSSRVRTAALPLARFGLRGAVFARYWIYQRREPTSIANWVISAVVMAAISIRALLTQGGHPAFVLASAIFGAAFIGYFHSNVAGLTGPPLVLEAMALSGRRQLRSYFAGQNIMLAVIGVPLLTLVSFGLAAIAKRPEFGFLGTAVGLAGLGAALAVSNLLTVALPYPMDKRAGRPMRRASQGYGLQGFLGILGCLLGVGVASIPMIVAVTSTDAVQDTTRIPVLIVVGAAYGFVLALAGVRLAAIAAEGKLPELCQTAIRSKL